MWAALAGALQLSHRRAFLQGGATAAHSAVPGVHVHHGEGGRSPPPLAAKLQDEQLKRIIPYKHVLYAGYEAVALALRVDGHSGALGVEQFCPAIRTVNVHLF